MGRIQAARVLRMLVGIVHAYYLASSGKSPDSCTLEHALPANTLSKVQQLPSTGQRENQVDSLSNQNESQVL